MHAQQSSGVRGRLFFCPNWAAKTLAKLHRRQACLSLGCSHIYVIIYKYLAHLYVKCEATKTQLACGSNNQMAAQKCSIKWSLL